MSSDLTNEEKRRLSNERQNAVRNAWKEEKTRVQNGFGTRDWSAAEQKELIERGAVSGYQGHHMKSVSQYPEFAGDPKNIQFLNEEEHIFGAHQGNTHNSTNGYYDPVSKTMTEFKNDELGELPVVQLSDTYSYTTFAGNNGVYVQQEKGTDASIAVARQEYIDEIQRVEQDCSSESLDSARVDYENDVYSKDVQHISPESMDLVRSEYENDMNSASNNTTLSDSKDQGESQSSGIKR